MNLLFCYREKNWQVIINLKPIQTLWIKFHAKTIFISNII